jgi:cation transport regulator
MPYEKIKNLPEDVKGVLPQKAQEIYLEAYNSAWDQYRHEEDRKGNRTLEETAHAIAWAAVKKKYKKEDDQWTSIK